MEILLFSNFSKRKNSTKRPTDSDGVSKTVNLKGECSVLNPSFFIADVTSYTYLKAWGNYYFIDRVAYDINGAQYINCSIDVLATWREQILATNAFIKYSSSNFNPKLADNRIIPTVDMQYAYESTPSDLFLSESEHHQNEVVILTALDNAYGIQRYVLDEHSLKTVFAELQQEAMSIVGSLLIDESAAMSSVIDVLRLPIEPSEIPDAGPVPIGFGDWTSSYECAYLVANFTVERKEITIPWIYTDFRKGAPFTELFLELPFVGIVELNPQDFFDTGIVDIRTCVNLYNGHIDYKITDGSHSNKTVGSYSAQCGGGVPIATMQVQNASQAIGGAVNTAVRLGAFGVASNLEAENVVQGARNAFEMTDMDYFNHATGIGSSVIDFLQSANTMSSSIIGSYSGGYGEVLNTEYNVIVRCKPSSEEPSNLAALYGRPCGKVLSLASLTGFVQTLGFSIDINALREVKNTINMMMDNGVYLE